MVPKKILVTGASGCIGHYITEALIQETDYDLYLLVRNPNKLQVDTQSRPGITILQGDMQEIKQFSSLLKTIDIAVLTATAWGGADVFDTNVVKTHELLNLLSPDCQQVIYFSTASILDGNNQLLKQAGEIGTDYIRSKYDCLLKLSKSAIAPKVTTLFPTLVVGGDAQKPYSHLTTGLPEVVKWVDLIRFLKVDGSFHFIHARDIAQVVRYFIDHPPQSKQDLAGKRTHIMPKESFSFVLGQNRLTVNQIIAEICNYLNKKIYFSIPLSLSLANVLIVLFQIQMAAWDRFCLQYRHFTYENPVNPSSLGLTNYCATITDVLQIYGISPGVKH
jgi:nucleoside-diphosphate-sugar epimerase